MAIIGMDIHRAFAEVVALEGKTRRRLGRIDMRLDRLAAFAAGLKRDDILGKSPLRREQAPTKYWLSTLPGAISFRRLVDLAKLR